MPDPNVTVRDNTELSRYEILVDDDVAGFSRYTDQAGGRVFIHTKIDPDYEGQGLGSQLARAALDDVRSKGMAVVARCPFIAEFVSRHGEYADLIWQPE
jgi:predicted GNAT family acetyltransferase